MTAHKANQYLANHLTTCNVNLVSVQALERAGAAKQTAKEAAERVADALAKVENISSILGESTVRFYIVKLLEFTEH